MIGFLHGKIVSKQPPLLVIDVQGVGYEVEAPMSTFYALESQQEAVKVLTHLHVREDAMLLFGFATEAERTLFRLLLKVNGVGAKMALAILSSMTVNDFCDNVSAENAQALTQIPGVGKKTAERLLIEVRDRLAQSGLPESFAGTTTERHAESAQIDKGSERQASAISALMALGYKEAQAQKWIKQVYQPELSVEALIKAALQQVTLA